MAYFLAVIVTTLSVRDLDKDAMRQLILQQSTNVHNLTRHPVHVLFLSAFWLDSTRVPILLVILFVLVLAPTERHIGTWRWLVVGAAAHVIATLLTESFVGWAAHHHVISRHVLRTADVGVSYFTVGVTAVAITLLSKRLRPWVLAALFGYLLFNILRGETYTDYGHMLSLLIGLLLAPWATSEAQPFDFTGLRRAVRLST